MDGLRQQQLDRGGKSSRPWADRLGLFEGPPRRVRIAGHGRVLAPIDSDSHSSACCPASAASATARVIQGAASGGIALQHAQPPAEVVRPHHRRRGALRQRQELVEPAHSLCGSVRDPVVLQRRGDIEPAREVRPADALRAAPLAGCRSPGPPTPATRRGGIERFRRDADTSSDSARGNAPGGGPPRWPRAA